MLLTGVISNISSWLGEALKVSLDLYLEADKGLTVPILGHALENAGALEVFSVNGALVAHLISGVTLTANRELTDVAIYAEDRKGMDFRVAMRCSVRIKGPEPECHSSMEDLDKIAKSIARACSSLFLVTFQFQELLYWRDATGLHRP